MGETIYAAFIEQVRIKRGFVTGLWGAWTSLMIFAKEGTVKRLLFTGVLPERIRTLADRCRFFNYFQYLGKIHIFRISNIHFTTRLFSCATHPTRARGKKVKCRSFLGMFLVSCCPYSRSLQFLSYSFPFLQCA